MFHVKHLVFILVFIPLFSFSQIGTTELPVVDLPIFKQNDSIVRQFNNQFPEIKSFLSIKQEWFYWTNYSRNNPKEFYDSVVEPLLKSFPTLKTSNTNSLRKDLYKATSLPMMKPSKNLQQVAQSFASQMADKKASPSHISPSGSTFQSRMESIRIKNCAGENLSYGPTNTVLMLVLLYIDEGVSGLGHRKTLLDPMFTEMGIGYAEYPDNKHIVIQDFSCNQTP